MAVTAHLLATDHEVDVMVAVAAEEVVAAALITLTTELHLPVFRVVVVVLAAELLSTVVAFLVLGKKLSGMKKKNVFGKLDLLMETTYIDSS